jgi:hypothetical protein
MLELYGLGPFIFVFFLRYSDVDERNKKEGITCINGQLKFDPGLCKGAAFCCTFFLHV